MSEAGAMLPAETLNAEEMLIALALRWPGIEVDLADALSLEDFHGSENRCVFAAISQMAIEGTDVDLHSVVMRLRRDGHETKAGGVERLIGLAATAVSAAELPAYVRMAKEASLERRLRLASESISLLPDMPGPVADRIGALQSTALSLDMTALTGGALLYRDGLPDVIQAIVDDADGIGDRGLATGLNELDLIFNGAMPGDLIVLAGRPGMGKSILADIFARQFSSGERGSVILHNYEMSAKQVMRRSIAAAARVQVNSRFGIPLTSEEHQALIDAGTWLRQRDITIDTDIIPVSQIVARTIMRARKGKIAAVIIDYLQLIPGESHRGAANANENERLSEITRALKLLAMRVSAPVVLLSQLNRSVESRDNKRPRMSDLRGSGGIEQDADAIMLLYRDDYYNPDSPHRGEVEIAVAKQRGGALGIARQSFEGRLFSISDRGAFHSTPETLVGRPSSYPGGVMPDFNIRPGADAHLATAGDAFDIPDSI